jgi:hypothetical protein
MLKASAARTDAPGMTDEAAGAIDISGTPEGGQAMLEAYEQEAIELARRYNIDSVLIACEANQVSLLSITSLIEGRAPEFACEVRDWIDDPHALNDET